MQLGPGTHNDTMRAPRNTRILHISSTRSSTTEKNAVGREATSALPFCYQIRASARRVPTDGVNARFSWPSSRGYFNVIHS